MQRGPLDADHFGSPSRHEINWPRLAGLALGVAVGALVLVAVVSDRAAPDHDLGRDPISFFGSPLAPHPDFFNLALGVVGVAVVLCSVSGWLGRARVFPILVAAAGVSLVLLAVWPIDCSPVDGLCEVLIRGRLISASHDAHSVVGLVFFLLVAAITVSVGRATWRISTGVGDRWVIAAGMLITLVAPVLLVSRPFAPGQAIVEAAAVVAAVAVVGLARRRGTPGLEFAV